MRTVAAWLLCASLAAAAPAGAIEITELHKGVWAALQRADQRLDDSNSLIVAADDYLIVVDAQESADDVRQIIAFARDEVHKPVRYVINTHWHSDHTQGNTLYRREYGTDLTIVGHETLLEDVPKRAAPYVRERVETLKQQLPAAREQLGTGIKRDGSKMTPEELEAQTARVARAEAWVRANDGVHFTVPTLTVKERYAHEAGIASFTIYPLRGHTRGDLIVHFPRLGVLATGDLVDVVPYAGHGYPREWLSALKQIAALPAQAYVPGHGGVLSERSLINKLAVFFEALTAQVDTLVRAGQSLEDVKAKVDLSASRALLTGNDEQAQRFFDEVQGEAIERAYAEAKGTAD